MNELYKNEINSILEKLGKELDISESEYKAAEKSYIAVGNYLSEGTSPLLQYNPKIIPQGSFMLGTIVKPISEDDDIDIDLVCKLEKKPDSWTQEDLKNAIGDRLKASNKYNDMLEDINGGRRCWTLEYSEDAG